MIQAGDITVTLKLDIRPYAEGIKSALAMGKMFEQQAQNMFNLKGKAVDTSKIDAELKNLEKNLSLLPSAFNTANSSRSSFTDGLGQMHTINVNVNKTLSESAAQVSIVGLVLSELGSRGVQIFNELLDSATQFKKSLIGLENQSRVRGIDPKEAVDSVRNLQAVKDGIISLADASAAYKNLIGSGLGIDQTETLLNRFIDAAITGKKETQSLGDAVVTSTQGFKENSGEKLNNIGYTKNLAEIYKEAGLSQKELNDDLNKGTINTKAYNIVVKDLAKYQGDAAKLTNEFEGKQAKLDATTQNLKATIGIGLQKSLIDFLDLLEEIIPGTDATGEGFLSLSNIVRTFVEGVLGPAVQQLRLLSTTFQNVTDDLIDFYRNIETGNPALDALLNKLRKITEEPPEVADPKLVDDGYGGDDFTEEILRDEFGNPIEPVKKFKTVGYAKEVTAEEGSESSKGKEKTRQRKEKTKEEILTMLEEIDKQIGEAEIKLELNLGIEGAEYEIEQQLNELRERRREITGESLKDVTAETAILDSQREKIERVIDTMKKKNELFEKIVEESKQRVIDSDEFQAAQIAFVELADFMRNQFANAWRDIFGEADTLAEIFIQSLAQKFLDLALNFAVSSILSAIFPLAGIIPSFFGGSPAGGATGIGNLTSSGSENPFQGFVNRVPQVNQSLQTITNVIREPYILSHEIKGKDLKTILTRVDKIIGKRES